MAPKAKPKKARGRRRKKESAEARKARLDMEALAAAEAEAARQADARRTLRERAEREAALTAVNARKLDAEWLQRMRSAKLEELREEARVLSREHDAQVDRRDRLIEALLEDVATANKQHSLAAAAHAEVLDSLAELHATRMAALKARFDGDLAAMGRKFEGEKAEMGALHHRQKKELQEVLAALQASYAETRAEAVASYRLMEEELRNHATEGLNVTKLGLEGRIRELEGAVEAQHRGYLEATGEQEAAYRELAAADAEVAAAIAQRTARLRQMQETLVQWRGRIVTNSSEWQRRNTALAKEKEIVLGHHTALKGALAKFRQGQEARLKQMCVTYASVEAGLKEQLGAAQRIIRLAQLSRRHEVPADAASTAAPAGDAGSDEACADAHEQQRVQGGDAAQEGQQAEGAESSRPSSGASYPAAPGTGEGQALDELGLRAGSSEQRLVDAFVRRTSGAALGRAALEQERLRLGAENATLRAVLASVQAGSSVGPGAVDGPLSTLMIVNGRLQKALGGAAAARRALEGQQT
ncbi:coiled-coil domain-containing 65 [Chlorella sorokiniana]|uniref:Dynein regulatory complex subunit 2 n=1 Tax=Chlorella sorokiniana TaxID=3076 RepID=A0A2P6TXN2_CHLSO|nr:coiled-coil domain-containing 65 [Chlorella sorokiniana]|eukprot:PRW58825.1 coiled-coil domain-containing 65 [Chlorella sorokiniana]